MFKLAEKTDLNQISLTGTRAIVLLGLLIMRPHTLEEIRQAFISLKIMEESHSNDIIRIDLNTLKYIGCKISRADSKTDKKYILSDHPFALKISDDEIKLLKRVYKSIKPKLNLTMLIDFDSMFKKMAQHIYDKEVKEQILGISTLKYYDIDSIKRVYKACQEKRNLTLLYKNPNSGKETETVVAGQDLIYQRDKIMLHAYDLKKQASVTLNFKRIVQILSIEKSNQKLPTNSYKVKFKLLGPKIDILNEQESILETHKDHYIIEGSYHNEFVATQRILSLGVRSIVLEPVELRNNIIEKLKEMRKAYEH